MHERLAEDARKLAAVLRSGPASAKQLCSTTALSHGRVRIALAYLLGGATIRGKGGNPTTWSMVGELPPEPEFDHVYAAIEDCEETLAEVWREAPTPLRHRLECCMVWLKEAREQIDGEADDG